MKSYVQLSIIIQVSKQTFLHTIHHLRYKQ